MEQNKNPIFVENLSYQTEKVIGYVARIGLIVLATDYTMEHEFRKLISMDGVDIFHSRIKVSTNITQKSLARMESLITKTAELLLPEDSIDVLAYGCTSASMLLGTERIDELLKLAKPETKTTNPAEAAFSALRKFGAKKIAVITPYSRSVNEVVKSSIETAGFEIPTFGSFNISHDPTVASINEESLINAIKNLAHLNKIDAVFVSCTSLRLAHAVSKVEKEIGLPVTTSNHALAWRCLRLAGIDEQLANLGRLYML
tara:strand:+ start:79 stop:852 length:774 start_codon:yes stop_codon:yes gene_type:complete